MMKVKGIALQQKIHNLAIKYRFVVNIFLLL